MYRAINASCTYASILIDIYVCVMPIHWIVAMQLYSSFSRMARNKVYMVVARYRYIKNQSYVQRKHFHTAK